MKRIVLHNDSLKAEIARSKGVQLSLEEDFSPTEHAEA